MTRSRLATAAAMLGGLFFSALLLAAPASAHATVVSTNPVDGSRLAKAPSNVSVVFDEDVGLGSIGYLHVIDQSGRRVDAGPAFHPAGDGSTVRDDLEPNLPDGSYTASFRVISADSHPVAGTIAFVVGNGVLVHAHSGATTNDLTTDTVFDVIRWITYAGFALLGGGWLVLTVWGQGRDDRRARRLIWTGWTAAVAGAVLELLVQGPYTAAEAPYHLLDPTLVDATLHTTYGQLHCTRLVLLGVLALLLARSLQPDARRSWRDPVAGVLAVAALVTISAGGHASTTSPAWLSITDDVLHLTAMATWLGGLVMLGVAVLPRREDDELTATLPLFSRVAFVSVVVLAVTGTYSAWRGVGTWGALFTTTYGLLVLGKVLLFCGVVAIANVSRQFVRRRAQPHTLRRSVLAEIVVAVVVLGLTAALVNEPRGREALQASYRSPVSATTTLGSGQSVQVTVDPGVHGQVNVTVTLVGTTAESVTAGATDKARQIGPVPVALTRESGDTFDGPVTLPVAGDWEFDLVVTQSQFDAVGVAVTLTVH